MRNEQVLADQAMAEADKLRAVGLAFFEKPGTNPTTNAVLLAQDDRLLLDAIKAKRADGWTVKQIARYYNIYEGQGVHGWGAIPAKLYEVAK